MMQTFCVETGNLVRILDGISLDLTNNALASFLIKEPIIFDPKWSETPHKTINIKYFFN